MVRSFKQVSIPIRKIRDLRPPSSPERKSRKVSIPIRKIRDSRRSTPMPLTLKVSIPIRKIRDEGVHARAKPSRDGFNSYKEDSRRLVAISLRPVGAVSIPIRKIRDRRGTVRNCVEEIIPQPPNLASLVRKIHKP